MTARRITLLWRRLREFGFDSQGISFTITLHSRTAFVTSKLWDPATKTLYHRWRDGERDSAQLLNRCDMEFSLL